MMGGLRVSLTKPLRGEEAPLGGFFRGRDIGYEACLGGADMNNHSLFSPIDLVLG